MASPFSFPNPVNEKAARVVAGGVLAIAVTTLVLSVAVDDSWLWLVALLAAGFVARVASGPRFSALGLLATRVVAPRLGSPKLVAGPPKRFAQAIGATVTILGVVFLAAGMLTATQWLLGVLVVAAGLESILGVCLGCIAFAWLMRVGVIPESTCEACANFAARA